MFPGNLFQDPIHQAFELTGGKAAALLIHGFPGTPAEMRPIAEHLHKAGWSVHGILLPGFGPEINQLGNKNYEDWIGAVLMSLDSMERDYSTRMICGFSMGATLALIATSLRQVQGTVLLAPYWSVSNWLWKLTPMIQFVFPEIKPFRFINLNLKKSGMRQGLKNLFPDVDLKDPAVQQQLRDFSFPSRIINEIRKLGLSASKSAMRITSPLLVIQGAFDEVVKPSQTKKLVAKIPGNVIYKEVNAEHDLPVPTKPAWNTIQSMIDDFSITLLRNNTLPDGDDNTGPAKPLLPYEVRKND
jgi:carboxylesterase